MQIVTADVKFTAGKVFNGRWGRRQNVVFESLSNGQDITVWFNEGDRRYLELTRGQRVNLIKEGTKYTLVDPEEPEAEDEDLDYSQFPPMPKQQATVPPTETRAIVPVVPEPKAIVPESQGARSNRKVAAAKAADDPERSDDATRSRIINEIKRRANVMMVCHLEMHKRFSTERGELIISDEVLKSYAITLYIDIKDQL